MLYCGYGNFTGEEDDLMQDRKLEQALEIYFQENPDRESDKYQEIQKYLKLRIRSVMELLIENEDTERMEQIEKCGWFSANELENFIRCAQEKAKLRSLVWLLHLKDKKYGYQKKTFHCKTTTEQELTGKKILQNCRNQLYLDFPYLDGAFTSLEYKADSSIDTIGTDGELIYFNPVFLMKKYLEDPAAVRRGYLHMLLHCLYLHIFMEPDRDSGEWDRECDCFVEQLIDKAVGEGKISLKKRKSDDTQVNTNTFDDHIFWQRTAGQASGGRRTKEKWEHILAYTSQNKTGMQSRAGTQTNDQQEELDEIYRSKYDYRKFLKQFCRLREEVELDTESFDYIFYSFGMEHYGNIPLIEPLEYKEVNRLEELVIAIDTSGSCSGKTVQRFLGETYGILSEKENFFSRMKVYIVQCDCFIQKVDVIHSEEEWKEYIRNVKIQGRGGTDFRPVFELIRQEKERKELKNLRALIYFTDGDGIYPGQKPDYETAFVFLKRTDKMKLVPPWAKCLITGTGQTAEQMSV